MPYPGLSAEESDALDACAVKVMAKGHDKSSAIAICRASMNMSETPVLRWVEPFAYKPGQAFRVMPLGEYKRGQRTLDLTPARLKAMAENYNAGRPRWKIPIYAGHPTSANPDPPKLGNAARLEFKDGEGLFAVPEYNEEGARVVASEGYQFVSPGVLWSLQPGSEYADENGQTWDNVCDHIALTNKPYFGANTALFSEAALPEPETMQMDGGGKPAHLLKTMGGMLKKMLEILTEASAAESAEPGEPPEGMSMTPDMQAKMKAYLDALPFPAQMAMKQKMAAMTPAEREAHIREMLKMSAEGMAALPIKETDMADKTVTPAAVAPAETFAISAEEFAAVKAQAEKATALESQMVELKTKADTFATNLQTERKARRLDQLTAECETFMALPAPTAELAPHLLALEEWSKDEFAYFMGALKAADKALTESELFSQKTTVRGGGAETFEAVIEQELQANFGGDRDKYGEAMSAAAQKRPDLSASYKTLAR